ncbi:MAG: hypothetical protein AMJ84_13320 [Acidithiobacillales bacterium SM23_46]|nr:MAG: hypothetical protein AMJ84_13320 [Acidithiobacillales bacterium SM23_46]
MCRGFEFPPGEHISDEEAEANARLIAAATELLEACKAALAEAVLAAPDTNLLKCRLCLMTDESDPHTSDCAVYQLKAAIAKAQDVNNEQT